MARKESKVWLIIEGLIAFATVLIFCAVLEAQQSTATVAGTVTDQSGALVPGATVTLTNRGTSAERTVITGGTGDYTVSDLPVGNYSLSVSRAGFRTTTVPHLLLQVGQSLTINVKLAVGASTQKVTVSAASPLLNTISSDVGQVVSRSELEDIPLNGRAFWQLTQLTPGALYTPGGSSPYTGSSAIRSTSVTVTVNSGNVDMTGYTLDGADITEVQLGSTLVQPNVDAIQEFKVESSNTNAQFGRTPTAVEAVIKSGTNQFHGDLWEFLRNDALDARNMFYFPSPGNPYTKNQLKRNQFGYTLGGPIKRNKWFFFTDLEATRVRQAIVADSVVPSLAERQGDYAAELPGTQLTNPYNGYQPFPGNIIPQSMISPQAKFFMNYLPEPNVIVGTTDFAAFGTPMSLNEYKGDAKVDGNVTSHDHLMARYSVNDYDEDNPDSTTPALGILHDHSRGQDATLAWTHTFSPSWLNVAQFGFYRMFFLFGPPLPGVNWDEKAGIQGFNQQYKLAFPEIELSGYTGVDGAPSNCEPKENHIRTYEYADTVSHFAGKHDMKMGLQWFHDTAGFTNAAFTNGIFNFSGSYTGDAFADYLLGVPYEEVRDGGVPMEGFYENDPSLFVQDNYRVSRNLTLNLGLRWDRVSFWTGDRGQMAGINLKTGQVIIPSNFDPTAQPISASLIPLYKDRYAFSNSLGLPDSLVRTYNDGWAPRVGFAWAPFGSDKWAVRSGYGIYYPFVENDQINNLDADPPLFIREDNFNNSPPEAPQLTWGNFFLGAPLAGTPNPSPGQPCPSIGAVYLTCNIPSLWASVYGSQTAESVQEWNFSVQRQLTRTVSVTLGSVGNATTHLISTPNVNDPAPGPGDIQPRRPLKQWGPIIYSDYNETANYNSLQLSAVTRSWHGLTLLGNYTWSKCYDNGNDQEGFSILQYPHEYGPCDNSRVSASAISYDYLLPVGQGRYFLGKAHGWANQILGGWELSGVLTLQSGMPFTPLIDIDQANTGTTSSEMPNLIGPAVMPRNANCWFYSSYDPLCQSVDPTGRDFLSMPALYSYGNGTRNSLWGPGLKEWDAAFLKRFRITESKSLEFRAEFFDLPNYSNLSNPNGTFNASEGPEISSTALPDREIELALKFFF